MKKFLLLGAAAAALCLGAMPAMADVTIPTGPLFGSVADIVIAVVPAATVGVLTWALNKYFGIKLDAHYNDYIKGLEADALTAAKNRLQEAMPSQVVIPTSNELVTEGAKWIIETEAPALVKWFGGADGIKKWLEGKINVLPADPSAS